MMRKHENPLKKCGVWPALARLFYGIKKHYTDIRQFCKNCGDWEIGQGNKIGVSKLAKEMS